MTKRKRKTNSKPNGASGPDPQSTASLLNSLVTADERMVKMHPLIPESTRDILKIVAGRRRVDMVDVVREVLVEWARAKEGELLAEARARDVTGEDVELARKAVAR